MFHPEWEPGLISEELKQNADTEPGMQKGASGERKAGDATHQGPFPQEIVSTRLEAVWMTLFRQRTETPSLASTKQLPAAYLSATSLQFAMPMVVPHSHQTESSIKPVTSH